MSSKPSYLGLLNAIALAECRAHTYLTAWAGMTSNPEVKAVLETVAAREGEHGMSFAKRLNELGFSVLDREDPGFEKRLAVATSGRSDLEKMEKLGLNRLDTGDGPDIFDDVFRDHSIDIATGALLGRYIAEERDTARLLRSCYEQLKAGAGADSTPSEHGRDDRLSAIEGKIDALCRATDELRQIVSGLGAPVSNGSARAKAGAGVRTRSKAKG